MNKEETRMKIGIIMGSIRENRVNEAVSEWVKAVAQNYTPDISYELVDLKDYQLAMFAAPVSPAFKDKLWTENQQAWSDKIKELDGYIFVTPEYNHSITAALKNAFDYLSGEMIDTAVGIISYGSSGGLLASNHLRTILTEYQVADVSAAPALNFNDDWEQDQFAPSSDAKESVETMLYQLSYWAEALVNVREKKDSDDTDKKDYILD